MPLAGRFLDRQRVYLPVEMDEIPALVRIGDLAHELGLPIKTVRRLADQRTIPSEKTGGGHRLFDIAAVKEALEVTQEGWSSWSGDFELDGLDESQVWRAARAGLTGEPDPEAERIANYSFTEMLNNAIDHSGGTTARVRVEDSPVETRFRIEDDGEGVFAHLRAGLGLAEDIEAAGELTKGKRTTFRERHTGEGIFFTSKAVSRLSLAANGLLLTFDNTVQDFALGQSQVRQGTVVEASIRKPPARPLISVFEEFTDDELRFSKTRPIVKLFETGLTFISRSEGRRVVSGLNEFAEVELDFSGVESVGQGFVDEVFRVWPSQHPGVRIVPSNMNRSVEFMVRRSGASW